MTSTTRAILLASALIFAGPMAMAAVTTDQVVETYKAQGYSYIEVKQGPTQIKVEAVKGSEKVEVVIDMETGAVLKQETEQASAEDQGRSGVEIRTRKEDFVEPGDDDEDGVDDNGDDDGDDDHGGDDHGGDDGGDDGDDDHGGDHDGGDDDHGDDDN
ncbi:PepSY domain-containing protein [Neotabrizicola sp. sgz301269]|uniref:PepSY domain-containing protein n=1 Tax=Neotabrizicola sp. sgz301269 TaxID=3276282 RepID=UPI00376FAF96